MNKNVETHQGANHQRLRLLKVIRKKHSLSEANFIYRFLTSPLKYIHAKLVHYMIYPIFKRVWLSKTRTFWGDPFWVNLPAGMDIYLLGIKAHESELRLCAFLSRNVKPGDCILDIGAHFGFYSLFSSFLTEGKGTILAIEPSKKSFSILQKNTQAAENVLCRQIVIGDKRGVVPFYEFPIFHSEYNSTVPEQFKYEKWYQAIQPQKVEIEMRTIDDLVSEEGLAFDIVKIDAEGSEDLVIQGGLRFIEKYSPCVVMEYLSDPVKNEVHRRAAQMLKTNHYRSYVSDLDGNLHPVSNIDNYLKKGEIDSENIIFMKDLDQ